MRTRIVRARRPVPCKPRATPSRLLAATPVAMAVVAVLLPIGVASASFVYNVQPTFIRTNGNYIGFRTVEAIQNPANCSSADFYAVPTAYDSKAALAVLLAANLAGRTVTVIVSNNLCEPNSGRPIVTDVMMDN